MSENGISAEARIHVGGGQYAGPTNSGGFAGIQLSATGRISKSIISEVAPFATEAWPMAMGVSEIVLSFTGYTFIVSSVAAENSALAQSQL